MMKKRFLFYMLFIGAFFYFASCSSAPKRPAEIYSVRQLGENQLNLVNKSIDQGDYDKALALLTEARRLAVSADYPNLRARTKIAEGNILYNLDRADEADAAWNNALAEAEASDEAELASQIRIYLARTALITKRKTPDQTITEVTKEIASLKNDQLSIALGWNVVGLAQKEKKDYGAAEDSFKKSLDIHAKLNYLELAAYDWYLTASALSLSGKFDGAVEALRSAIAFDRRAENAYGLAADWRALGDVYRKAGKTVDAKTAYARSAEIFRSIAKETEAVDAENRLE